MVSYKLLAVASATFVVPAFVGSPFTFPSTFISISCLTNIFHPQSTSTSCVNGVCCVNGSTENGVCCPFGDIYGDTCCMTEQGVDGTQYGFIYSSGSCPDGAISIPMDAPNYTSSVSSAASKLGASIAPIFTSTGGAATATTTQSDLFTSTSGTSATATQTGSATATTSSGFAETSSGTAAAGSTNIPGSNSESSTSTGAAPYVTVAAVPLGFALGVGAFLI